MLNIYFGKKNEFKTTDDFIRICYKKAFAKKTYVLREEKGNPKVESGYVSVTHTGEWIAVCFFDVPIGIDMELMIREDIDDAKAQKLAMRYFNQFEIEEVIEFGKNKFLEIWTQKEALLKKRGKGLSGGLNQIPSENELIKTFTSSILGEDFILSLAIGKKNIDTISILAYYVSSKLVKGGAK